MALDLPPIEIVAEISDEQQKQILKDHFYQVYEAFAGNQFVPDSGLETMDGIDRMLTGIPFPFLNWVFGYPNDKINWDTAINAQRGYFNDLEMPFAWFIEEGDNPEFQNKLKEHGFQNIGILQGVIGFLNDSISDPVLPEGCTLEAVETEAGMDEYMDLLAATFSFDAKTQECMKIACWNATKTSDPNMVHFAIRKEGKVVSIVSALISGNCVSLWNGASAPELRKQGLSTALCCVALKYAVSQGCQIGMSYLMTDAMAAGISTKLGGSTKWRLQAYLP
jgi:hypothetical protein